MSIETVAVYMEMAAIFGAALVVVVLIVGAIRYAGAVKNGLQLWVMLTVAIAGVVATVLATARAVISPSAGAETTAFVAAGVTALVFVATAVANRYNVPTVRAVPPPSKKPKAVDASEVENIFGEPEVLR